MNSYQMVLHRPVETAGFFGNFRLGLRKPVSREAGAIGGPSMAGGLSRLNEAKLASQLLAGGKVKEAVWLVVPVKYRPGSAKERQRYDACGHGTGRASRREHDSAPDCRR